MGMFPNPGSLSPDKINLGSQVQSLNRECKRIWLRWFNNENLLYISKLNNKLGRVKPLLERLGYPTWGALTQVGLCLQV